MVTQWLVQQANNKHNIFSGIRKYITRKARDNNKSDNNLATTSLTKKDTK